MEPEIIVRLLADVAEVEQQLEQARGIVSRYQSKREFLADLQQEYRDDVTVAADTGENVDQQIRKHESEIQSLTARIDQKKQQLDLIRDNKAYTALQKEITTLTDDIDQRETTVLQLIEQSESQQVQTSSLRQESDLKQTEIAGQLTELAADAEQATSQSAELEGEASRLISMLPPDIKAVVSRLRQGMAAPVAFLDEEACGGCHAQFPAQKAIEIGHGKCVIRCQACGRLVVPRY